jgi:hypothetical protein
LALVIAQSFAGGCEAGLAAVRSLDLDLTGTLPAATEPGRMPSHRRVQAFFGTNRLRLIEAKLNTRSPVMTVESLFEHDINPCFQALVLSRRLLTEATAFEVRTAHDNDPVIVVSARSVDAVMPAWEFAVTTFDQIPVSTFLPANLEARRQFEPDSLAERSAAWIAVDDALGAIDVGIDQGPAFSGDLLDARLKLVQIAARQTATLVRGSTTRFDSVIREIDDLRVALATMDLDQNALDDHPAVARIRLQWRRWGPVPRHPRIVGLEPPDPLERQPDLRRPPESYDYMTL